MIADDRPLTVGSLFSGIGGFDLGFERAGMRTVWFCEQDPFCQRVLARHWPGVPIHPDVRALVADTGRGGVQRRPDDRGVRDPQGPRAGEGLQRQRRRDAPGDGGAAGGGLVDAGGAVVPVPVPYVDVLCGGFPCQDISLAGKGAGIDGDRSGLWGEYARLIRELRPRYVVVENVAALLARGMERVLGDLAACGYDAEWDCIPASAVGAPHRRDRLWIVAYPSGDDGGPRWARRPAASGAREPESERSLRLADPARDVSAGTPASWPERQRAGAGGESGRAGGGADASSEVADADGAGQQRPLLAPLERAEARGGPASGFGGAGPGDNRADAGAGLSDADGAGPAHVREGEARGAVDGRDRRRYAARHGGGAGRPAAEWWATEPDVGRVAHGVPARVDRLRSLGNSLVPQIAEWIGHRIVSDAA